MAAGLWIVVALAGRTILRSLGNEGLATIGLLAALQFVVSYASKLSSDVLVALLGPFNVVLSGIGHEGLTSLIAAATVVLLPRPGAYLVSAFTLFALNGVFNGQFGLVDVLFVSIGAALSEMGLWVCGVTRKGRGNAAPLWSLVTGAAVGFGVANALTLWIQFSLYQTFYRLYFAGWFVALVALWTGLVYGSLGAAAGAWWGVQLRKVSR